MRKDKKKENAKKHQEENGKEGRKEQKETAMFWGVLLVHVVG